MPSFSGVLEILHRNKMSRDYPNRSDSRCNDYVLFPRFTPKFTLAFNSDDSFFTVGSCFARNIEEALQPHNVKLPTRSFSVPKEEWGHRPNGLLNEYNPGTISQRILFAMNETEEPENVATIVPSGSGYADLMLPGGSDVSYERALQRRKEIREVYRHLRESVAAIITLGYVECWFDNDTQLYLNRMPPPAFAKASGDRFESGVLTFLMPYPCWRLL